jgi:hypothetical protein
LEIHIFPEQYLEIKRKKDYLKNSVSVKEYFGRIFIKSSNSK